MATKAQLLGIINTQLASNQPILASQHRAQIITMLDELYNAQSRGNVLSGLPLTSLQLANDTFLAFRNGAALQVPFSAIFDDPLTLGTPNGLDLNGTVLSLGLASATTTGALSFADFSIFNAKENAFVKNTAFNKNFGTVANTVTQGNDARLSDARVPLAHTHVIGDVIGLQTALNNKENAFAKNTGFNKNFGTTVGTVAQGNDSRFHAAATLGTANGLSLAGQVLSLGLASTSATGALSAANFSIFNTKVGGSGTTNFLSKFTGAGTIGNSAVFENGGNVGIGTTDPSELTEISRNQNGTTRLLVSNTDSTNGNSRASIHTNSNGIIGEMVSINEFGVVMGASSNHNLDLMTNGSTKVRITSTGNVGIGTTNPAFKLDVNGAGRFSGILQVRNTASTPSIWAGQFGGAISILGDNATANRYIDLSIVDSNGFLATQGIRLINNGNVGIGTTDPSAKLDVQGNLRVATVPNAAGDYLTIGANGIVTRLTAAQVTAQVGGDAVTSSSTTIMQNNTSTVVFNTAQLNKGSFFVTATSDNLLGTTVAGTILLHKITGAAFTISNIGTNSNITFTISGSNLVATQTSGSTQTVIFSVVRITAPIN